MKAKQSLQKLTDSEDRISKLFKLDKITEDDTSQLSKNELARFNEIVNEKMLKANGDERDEILKKIEATLSDDTKNDFWEYNNVRIMVAISSLMKEYGRMPTRSEIAQRAELSRTTVYKHLREYVNHPLYVEQLQKMRILAMNVLSKVYQSAMDGDLGSRKLYLNVMGFMPNNQIQNQNNYIQINGLILSQETIKKLNPEQLLIIENILKAIIIQPELITADITRDN